MTLNYLDNAIIHDLKLGLVSHHHLLFVGTHEGCLLFFSGNQIGARSNSRLQIEV